MFSSEDMTDEIFGRFSQYIQSNLGIKMPGVKKSMLQARLQKRLRKLGIHSYEHYWEYIFSAEGAKSELPHFINVVTTNKTDFFREAKHFDFLTNVVLSSMVSRFSNRSAREVMIWSAGCSTGEEPYTLAMLLCEFSRQHPAFKFSIMGSDVSEEVISKAKSGIYSHDRIEPIPIELRKRYLLKSKDPKKKLVRVVPELRNMVRFFCLNLLTESFYFSEKMDIIFFRNVLIYFDLKTQQLVIERICNQLKEDGYLFIGHSETLNSIKAPLKQVSTSVYKKVRMDFS